MERLPHKFYTLASTITPGLGTENSLTSIEDSDTPNCSFRASISYEIPWTTLAGTGLSTAADIGNC